MCDWHRDQYAEYHEKPIRGLAPMDPNDEDFRPSLEDMIRHAEIALEFERQRGRRP